MRTRSLLALIPAVALFAACAGTPPANPAARPAATPAPGLAQNWRARVLVEREDSIILTLPSGDRQLQQFHRSAVFTLGVTSAGALSLRLDSLTLRPAADDGSHSATLPAAWSGRIDDPHVDALRVASGGDYAEELTSIVRQLLPRHPAGVSGTPATWTDSSTGKVRVDIFTAVERRSSVWAIAPGGALTLHEEYEQMGNGSQSGQRLTMTSQGRRSCTYYSTPSGVLTHASLVDSSAMLISIPGNGQMVPTVRFARASVRFISLPRESPDE